MKNSLGYPDDNVLLFFKFSEKQWIQKLVDGELSFSCIDSFIKQAISSGNDIQGDPYEGVFAHLRIDNVLVEEMRTKLGSDLEEIPDGDFLYLRRYSAKTKPIFCIYAHKNLDASANVASPTSGWKTVVFRFDSKMYSGFVPNSKTNTFTGVLLKSDVFHENVINALNAYKPSLSYNIKHVRYQDITGADFFIEPTDDYPELFIKSTKYVYQNESRICISNIK